MTNTVNKTATNTITSPPITTITSNNNTLQQKTREQKKEEDESMLPPVGLETEELPLRLLDEIYYTIVLCKRSKRCTELIKDLISRYKSYWQ